jgi:hypothetical protein
MIPFYAHSSSYLAQNRARFSFGQYARSVFFEKSLTSDSNAIVFARITEK